MSAPKIVDVRTKPCCFSSLNNFPDVFYYHDVIVFWLPPPEFCVLGRAVVVVCVSSWRSSPTWYVRAIPILLLDERGLLKPDVGFLLVLVVEFLTVLCDSVLMFGS